MTRPYSEWSTYTDEPFLMLCMETYRRKWEHEWRVQKYGQPASTCDQLEQARLESLYTAASQGTKRSWSAEGMRRFKTLMINVLCNRRDNGRIFDNMILEETKRKYSKVNSTRQEINNKLGDNSIARQQQTIVYIDFKLQF
jgi:hypothetical protein